MKKLFVLFFLIILFFCFQKAEAKTLVMLHFDNSTIKDEAGNVWTSIDEFRVTDGNALYTSNFTPSKTTSNTQVTNKTTGNSNTKTSNNTKVTGNLIVNGTASNGMQGWNLRPEGSFRTSTKEVELLDGPYFWPGVVSEAGMFQDILVKKYVGKIATASVYVRDYTAGHGDIARLILWFYGEGYRKVLVCKEVDSTKIDKWHKISITERIPEGTVFARIVLKGIRNTGSDCDAYFDNVEFRISDSTNTSGNTTVNNSNKNTNSGKVTNKTTGNNNTKTNSNTKVNNSNKNNSDDSKLRYIMLTMKKGTTSHVGAVITKETTTPVKFTSSDTSIATVDQKGYVKAIKKGMATITLKLNDSSLKVRIRVID